ncbi:MAG: flagellar hook-length control protein FliK [Paracoccaceae bacterium]
MRRGDGSFELALHPEELGRVRVAMKPGEGVMTLAIVAERHETLDLMRRHIDQLASEFREMGYNAVHVDLSGADGGERQDRHSPEPGPATPEHNGTDTAEPAAPSRIVANHDLSTGLDLRL